MHSEWPKTPMVILSATGLYGEYVYEDYPWISLNKPCYLGLRCLSHYCLLWGMRPFILPDGQRTLFLRVLCLSQWATLFDRSVFFLLSWRVCCRVCTFWATLILSTCAISCAHADTARALCGACLLATWDLLLATVNCSCSTEDSESLLSSPSLPDRLYTDMLGCSMSKFSRSVIPTLAPFFPAVKHGGGVIIQASFIGPWHVRKNKCREWDSGLWESGVECFDGLLLLESHLEGLELAELLLEWLENTLLGLSPWWLSG